MLPPPCGCVLIKTMEKRTCGKQVVSLTKTLALQTEATQPMMAQPVMAQPALGGGYGSPGFGYASQPVAHGSGAPPSSEKMER